MDFKKINKELNNITDSINTFERVLTFGISAMLISFSMWIVFILTKM